LYVNTIECADFQKQLGNACEQEEMKKKLRKYTDLAERRVAQVVAVAAELAEGRRVVAGQRLLGGAAARRRRRLNEARHVDVVEALRGRVGPRPPVKEATEEAAAQLTLYAREFRTAKTVFSYLFCHKKPTR